MTSRLLATSPFLAIAIAVVALMAPRPAAPACYENRGIWVCDIPPAKVDAHAPAFPAGRQAVRSEEKPVQDSDPQPPPLAKPAIVHPTVGMAHLPRAVTAGKHFAWVHSTNIRHPNDQGAIRIGGNSQTPYRFGGIDNENSRSIYQRTRDAAAGKPGLNPDPYGDRLASYANEGQRLDPWHGYDSRDGPGNGY